MSIELTQIALEPIELTPIELTPIGGDLRAALITALFGAGEAGALYDPSDSATVFQERTGASATTPAGADDPVGTRLDVSGNGAHSTAPADGRRPLLYTANGIVGTVGDGVDDALISTATISDACTLAWAGQMLDSVGVALCQNLSGRSNASFMVTATGTGGNGVRVAVRGGDLPVDVGLSGPYTTLSSAPAVMIAEWDGSALTVEVNGDADWPEGTILAAGGAGTVSHNNSVNSAPSSVRIFAEVRRAGTLTDAQRDQLRTWLASKAGITL